MAPPTPDTSLVDQLVNSLLPQGTSAPKLRKYKDAFSRKLKLHNFARTNQFEVSERLDALQEGFQILNNDELADALHTRLLKLKHRSEKWIPDILDLVLRLADDPTSKTRIEWLTNIGRLSGVVPSLTWAEIEADDPVDRKDQMWEVAGYSDLSSDEEFDVLPVVTPILDITRPVDNKLGDSVVSQSGVIDPDTGPKILSRLRGDQFWQNVPDQPVELTELQLIREVLFMLQGLQTALFWRVGDHFEIDKRFRLKNTSREAFVDVVSDFGQIAVRLDLLRDFVKQAQPVHFMQTLRNAIEEIIRDVDSQLQCFEQRILATELDTAATILQVAQSVSKIVNAAEWLADFVQGTTSNDVDTIRCLEILFYRVCQIQASGDESGFECSSAIFFRCFETYFSPARDWMDEGMLLGNQQTLFIKACKSEHNLSGLWKKWYGLTDDSASNRCPSFLQPFKTKILNIGKTVIFLQHLKTSTEASERPLKLELPQLICISASSLLPFSEVFTRFVDELVESRLHTVTSALREQLGNNCGLWKTLDAMENIYFGKTGYVTDLVDTKVFTGIDRCDVGWNDRFLLGDLLQTVFEPIESVEVERLAVISSSRSLTNLSRGRQSVKLLEKLQVHYALPWSIANVIDKTSLITYQNTSTFLTQIRRARYMLERRSLFQVRSGRPDAERYERNLNQLLHHSLLLFVNTLYDHLTSLVIEKANRELHQHLFDAIDIDAMIAAHKNYRRLLEDACLISKNLKPIHNGILSILDLCIRYSDLNSPTKITKSSHPDADDDADADSYTSATSHQSRRRHRHRLPAPTRGEISSSEEDSESDDGDGEGYSTFIVPEESTLGEQLRKVRAGFQKHRSFIVAGLNSIGRVGEGEREASWEILGRRLAWEGEGGSGGGSRARVRADLGST